eukprot:CAMPEP_0115745944 /NCGR_PEP_ID=MMETSP0272-20121206/92378_1 /TAXON_ID=71861 /ORGANISM="Scrippsiella trochoidea, Strain CCMP3099" /LENGTH=165 /DNA_ID=CAMNT_0003190861 /DNA_START=214 /DNA_END=712 /DNA_ORIENTATION=+
MPLLEFDFKYLSRSSAANLCLTKRAIPAPHQPKVDARSMEGVPASAQAPSNVALMQLAKTNRAIETKRRHPQPSGARFPSAEVAAPRKLPSPPAASGVQSNKAKDLPHDEEPKVGLMRPACRCLNTDIRKPKGAKKRPESEGGNDDQPCEPEQHLGRPSKLQGAY